MGCKSGEWTPSELRVQQVDRVLQMGRECDKREWAARGLSGMRERHVGCERGKGSPTEPRVREVDCE